MKRVLGFSLTIALALAAAPRPASAQFLPEQIAQRPAQEGFLLTAEIIASEPIGEGVTKPFKLTLRKDGVECKAAWKNPHGEMGGYLEGWQYEIAAYRIDKLIGLNMVPPAVEREFQGKRGALRPLGREQIQPAQDDGERDPHPRRGHATTPRT